MAAQAVHSGGTGSGISSYRTALCVIIASHTAVRRTRIEGSPLLRVEDDGLSNRGVQQVTAFLMREVKGHDDGVLNRSLSELCAALVAAVPGEGGSRLQAALEGTLEGIRGPDSVASLFDDIANCMVAPNAADVGGDGGARPTHIDRSSQLGLFLRRCLLEERKGGFAALARGFDRLSAYRAAESDAGSGQRSGRVSEAHALDEFDFRSPSISRRDSVGRRSVSGAGSGVGTPGTTKRAAHRMRDMTPAQRRCYFEALAARVESLVGVLPRHTLREEIEGLLLLAPETPAAHLAHYLTALHNNEYEAAVENLHRYFDYSLVHARKGGSPDAAPATTQYAVLNLAALHLWFGHSSTAGEALRETVRVAQQNGDSVCVAFALALLAQVMADEGEAQPRDMLRRCRERAAELHLWRLQALSAMAEADLVGSTGVNVPVDSATIGLAGAAEARSRQAASAPDWLSFDPATSAATGGAQLGNSGVRATLATGSVLGNTGALAVDVGERLSLHAAQRAVRSRWFDRGAHRGLRDVGTKTQLYCFAGRRVRGSNLESWTELSKRRGREFDMDAPAHAVGPFAGIEALAKIVSASDAEPPFVASKDAGVSLAGLALGNGVAGVGEASLLRSRHEATVAAVSLWHEASIFRGEAERARALSSQLGSLSSASSSKYGAVEAALAWVRYLKLIGRVEDGRRLLVELDAATRHDDARALRAEVLLTLASLFLEPGPTGCSGAAHALPHLLQALALCDSSSEKLRMDAVALLGSMLCQLGQPALARQRLLAVVSQVLEHGSARCRAAVCLVLAKCELMLERDSDWLVTAQNWLERALADFSRLSDVRGERESAYLLARTLEQRAAEADAAGLPGVAELRKRRNRAAREFLVADSVAARGLGVKALPLSVLQDMETSAVALAVASQPRAS